MRDDGLPRHGLMSSMRAARLAAVRFERHLTRKFA
jgi:hypothetical protein